MPIIYTESNDRKVSINIPVEANPGTMGVSIYDGNTKLVDVSQVTQTATGYEFVMPFNLTTADRDLRVRWVFEYTEDGSPYEYDQFKELSVCTPILPLNEIKGILGSESSDADVYEIERAVRYIIQSHTGQSFGRYVGVRSVTGSGKNFLKLPARLLEVKSVNGQETLFPRIVVRGDGWYLQSQMNGVPSMRADWDGWHENPWSGRVPITAPNSKTVLKFMSNVEYRIDGVWGWKAVPEGVKEAARLLINDYACGDSSYRDRFLVSMTAADWRIQFHDGAFSNTGNVRANQLLAEYTLQKGWLII